MIITITEITQETTSRGSPYRKIKGVSPDGKETTKSIFDNLKDSWPLLVVGAILDFKLEKRGQYWNVVEIKPAKSSITSPNVSQPVEPQEESAPKQITEPPVNPLERGMWWKELGECLRKGDIDKNTPQGKQLRTAYYKEMFRVLDIKSPQSLLEAAQKEGGIPIVEKPSRAS